MDIEQAYNCGLFDQIAPRYCSIIITERCNNNCYYCGYHKLKNCRDISREQFLSALSILKKIHSIKNIYLTGGEPILNKNFYEYVQYVKNAGKTVTTMTNGILLLENAGYICENIDALWVSIDTFDKQITNSINSNNVYDDLIKGVNAVTTINPEYNMIGCCTIHKANVANIYKTLLFMKEIGIKTACFQAMDAYSNAFGRDSNSGSDYRHLLLNDTELDILLTQINMIKESRGLIGIENTDAELDYIYKYLRNAAKYPSIDERISVGCTVSSRSVVIDVDGQYKPCFWSSIGSNDAKTFSREIMDILSQRSDQCFFCPRCG